MNVILRGVLVVFITTMAVLVFTHQVEVMTAAVAIFIAVALTEALAIYRQVMMARVVEAMHTSGLAQGNASQGARQQGRNNSRQAGQQVGTSRDDGEAN